MKMFAIHDQKAQAFLTPFWSLTSGTAVREFSTAVNTADHQFNKFAGDYTLFEIADFEENTAVLTIKDPPVNLGIALSFLEPGLPMEPGPLPLGVIAGGD